MPTGDTGKATAGFAVLNAMMMAVYVGKEELSAEEYHCLGYWGFSGLTRPQTPPEPATPRASGHRPST